GATKLCRLRAELPVVVTDLSQKAAAAADSDRSCREPEACLVALAKEDVKASWLPGLARQGAHQCCDESRSRRSGAENFGRVCAQLSYQGHPDPPTRTQWRRAYFR